MPPRGTTGGREHIFAQQQQPQQQLHGEAWDVPRTYGERTEINRTVDVPHSSEQESVGEFLRTVSSGMPAVTAMHTEPWYSEAHQSLASLASEVKLDLDAGGLRISGVGPALPQPAAERASSTGTAVTQSSCPTAAAGGLPADLDDDRKEWDAMLLSVLSMPNDPTPSTTELMPSAPLLPSSARASISNPDGADVDGDTEGDGAAPQKLAGGAGSLKQTGSPSLSRRNSSKLRRANSKDPESVALATEQRALKKRIASRRRYADHKNRLDELKATTQEMLSTNKTLRSKLAEVQREIELYEQTGHIPRLH